jgi:hypothetical protein
MGESNRTMGTPRDDDIHAQTLVLIARGREDCGRPLSAERSRNLARLALVATGTPWTIPEMRAALAKAGG